MKNFNAIVDLLTESWRLSQATRKLAIKLADDKIKKKTLNQVSRFDKHFQAATEEFGLEVLDFTGAEFETGLPISPINLDDFAANENLSVEAMLEPTINAATLDAAKMAGLGKVALMQEPVAAIMRVMKDNQVNGNFLVFDLGGGTLDVAIAERISGKVNFLANGGLTMCGGRDFDRILLNEFVIPWLKENYSLPEDWLTQKKYQRLHSITTYMSETAKI